MTVLVRRRFWTGPRLFAAAAVAAVATLFIVANAHLIAVSFKSKPDCVLQRPTKGAVTYNAASPSC